MNTRFTLLVSLAVIFASALAGCGPPPPASPVCIDFEPPMALGTQYGTPAGHAPGTVVFTSNGIPVSVHDFFFVGGGSTFNVAEIAVAPFPFSPGQSINTNNINLEFDFTGLSFEATALRLSYLDLGGNENLSVNGSPLHIGELSAAPSPMGGVNVTVSTVAVAGGQRGNVSLSGGTIKRLRIGGQEFWLDQVCAIP